MTKLNTILENITKSINEISGLGCKAYRSRATPIQEKEKVAITVNPGPARADPGPVGLINWTAEIHVSIHVANNAPDSTADTYAEKTYEKIMSDTTAGGEALDIVPIGYDPKFYEATPVIGVLTYIFQVTYRTKENEL